MAKSYFEAWCNPFNSKEPKGQKENLPLHIWKDWQFLSEDQ